MKKFTSALSSKLKEGRNERGNLAIWYILMIPVFVAFLALAVDSAAIQSTKVGLQNSLDSATQGALAQSKTRSNGKPSLGNATEARKAVFNLYDANRVGSHSDPSGVSVGGQSVKHQSVPFLQCQRAKDMKPGQTRIVPPSGCGFGLIDFKYQSINSQPTVSVTVSEKADTIFMQILGFDKLYYTISSTAHLTSSTV